MLRCIVILLGKQVEGGVLLQWEVLVLHYITLGINLHLSLVSLAVEHDDFDRGGRDRVFGQERFLFLRMSILGVFIENS